MNSSSPIGVFDSGVGGLTVVKGIHEILSGESVAYLGDTARVPYGTKSPGVVTRYALNSAEFLVNQGAKAIVIACNTASAVAVEEVREVLQVPVIGVIAPGAQLAVERSTTGLIGVIGTEGTIASGSYQRAIAGLSSNAQVFTRACPLFVPLAEEGMVEHEVAQLMAQEYLAPLISQGIDTLVLGCTHYPILKKTIQAVVGPNVQIVDSATAVALSLRRELEQAKLVSTSPRQADRFYATDASPRFTRVGQNFLGERILGEVHHVDL